MTDFNDLWRPYALSFDALKTTEGLVSLDELFLKSLSPELNSTIKAWRNNTLTLTAIETSELQLEIARHLNRFISETLKIEDHTNFYFEQAADEAIVLEFKNRYVQRGAKRYKQEITESFNALTEQVMAKSGATAENFEFALAKYAMALEAESSEEKTVIEWATLALNTDEGKALTQHWVSFKFPERVDPQALVNSTEITFKGIPVKKGDGKDRRRDGFHLTDSRMCDHDIAGETDYCKYCHDHDGDFCSKGFPVKKAQPELGLKKDAFGNTQTGCPLDEKISEMITLRKSGHVVGALAMIMIENPMVPATGHRICNDCMKACIYQKTEPVNIPQIETNVLTSVLNLPWGVEIYDIFTRWNPLKQTDYLPTESTNRKVLVSGLGPAGFTMTHYLSQAGCHVVAVDGLKIEPLPEALLNGPVEHWSSLEEDLANRILYGFGGVAEYGITVRWDKNFLRLIYLVLARRNNVQIFGGVRLGGTLMLEDAFKMGFDHVSMAVGAGLPRVLNIENSLARGMRQASDFLMAMQLTGAAKQTSLSTLQVRMPAVVIGGGLTAVDAATEMQAYYIKQVEKVLHRVETLGEEAVRAKLFTPEDHDILDEFLTHGREVKAERERAAAAGEAPNFTPLLHKWGGVLLAYRRTMQESPAYTLNHEEITKAFEEGIFYGESLNPTGVNLDKYGHIESISFTKNGEDVTIPARTVLVAAGTSPNTIYATEHGTLEVEDQHHFQGYDILGNKVEYDRSKTVKDDFAPFTSFNHKDHRVSYIGDTHPTFNGNVVKAITSAKRTADQVIEAMKALPANHIDNAELSRVMTEGLTVTIESVKLDNPAVAEVWVKAPFVARNFKPGQFFRLQTYEVDGQIVDDTRLQIPLFTASGTGSKDDAIRLMVFQWGVAPRLVSRLKKGDRLVLAGPTGAPTDIPTNKNILIMAGRWGTAIMLDLAPVLREAGNKITYIATLGQASEMDKMDELEASTDQIVWCVQKGEKVTARRVQDSSVVATDMIELLHELDKDGVVDLSSIDRMLALGSTSLLKGLQKELSEGGRLTPIFKTDVEVMGTVGSPMQCMMKGVCGQCLQWQIDPITKKRTKAVFTCAGQDQNVKEIDLDNLTARTSQNRLLDVLNVAWFDNILKKID
ncbi:FAD-dependent oxidoreductase [Wohlfahrtiimonas chitiniclastica]|uniref:FAD-dependent oxidoreductase n=1 Tax=Wohlfahrtiimonas chitiniclastica TaxID=400946 RepID=UPI000B980AC9|nr:FAD-dependent oxidoreductase [Wohlfahrtiimonas chitiniclastica]OYQ71375.1 pyridine nucleotide-disulfide oxidoreductase [Wohlfahrtiimonas chitiniclastica]OYQ85253.1 pyridine nucleotide-disulfide oxidoreductase [Wohlfahrtiimonas chitiniclastica]OYQ86514.1 pyridine nucleotide-disulfide oxidoreductase [Wohlfahrtiimonas chitiniclastica]